MPNTLKKIGILGLLLIPLVSFSLANASEFTGTLSSGQSSGSGSQNSESNSSNSGSISGTVTSGSSQTGGSSGSFVGGSLSSAQNGSGSSLSGTVTGGSSGSSGSGGASSAPQGAGGGSSGAAGGGPLASNVSAQNQTSNSQGFGSTQTGNSNLSSDMLALVPSVPYADQATAVTGEDSPAELLANISTFSDDTSDAENESLTAAVGNVFSFGTGSPWIAILTVILLIGLIVYTLSVAIARKENEDEFVR